MKACILAAVLLMLSFTVLAQYPHEMGKGMYRCKTIKLVLARPDYGSTVVKKLEVGDNVQLDGRTQTGGWYRTTDGFWISGIGLDWVCEIYLHSSTPHQNNQPPPILEIHSNSIALERHSILRAESTNSIVFELENLGGGVASELTLRTTLDGDTQGLIVDENQILPLVKVGETRQISVPIITKRNTVDGTVKMTIEVIEPRGFSPAPFSVEILTESFKSPDIQVSDFVSSSQTWLPNTPIKLDVLLQNMGVGDASEVQAELKLPGGVVCFSDNKMAALESLSSGNVHKLSYDLIVPRTFQGSAILVQLELSESFGEYGSTWSHTFPFGVQDAQTLVVVSGQRKSRESEIAEAKLPVETNGEDLRVEENGGLNDKGYVEFNTNPKDVIVERVAVVAAEGMDCGGVLRPGQDLASYVEGSLLGYYEVVERRNLERVLDEQKLALSGIMFEKTTVEAGCNIGAQGIIFTEFGCIGGEETIQVKLVDCQTSELYWSATGHGSSILSVVKEIKKNLDVN